MAGVKPEIWTNVMVEDFRAQEAESFLNLIPSYDRYVRASANGQNESIHLVDVGASPEVLINNDAYPIAATELPDGDISISLDKFQTEVTIVTDDELDSIAYDKIRSVQSRHTNAIMDTKHNKAIHSLAPASHTTSTPVLVTTGVNDGTGRKRLTKADVVKLKAAFDKQKIPARDRVLVLSAEHVNDIILFDEKWENQYYNNETGVVKGVWMGFRIFSYIDNPYFTASTKTRKAFGSVPGSGDYQASVAFYAPDQFRAMGSTKFYYDKAANNPRTQQNEMNYRHYYIVLPRKQRAIGAIVSDAA